MTEPQSLLQRFFDASLIPADTDDERLGHYQEAAVDLAKRFGESPRDAVSASRVAIDPKCPATEPWFMVVQDAVKVHWKTFLANHHDAPRQICRAILLEALSIAVVQSNNLSAAVWNATSNLLPHIGSGAEQLITRAFISKLGEKCEAYSSELWRLGGSAYDKPPEFEIKIPVLKLSKVSEAELKKGLSDAAGPHNAQSKSFGNPNPHWSNQNPSHWVGEFAERAATTIASQINEALTAITPLLKGVNEQLGPNLNQYAAALGEWVINSTQTNSQFTELLWWKQALYSPSLKRTYRGLSTTEITIATSFDLSAVSGAPVPVSVEYFLREVIQTLVPDNPLVSLADMAEAAKTNSPIEPCLPTAPDEPLRRISLREFLALSRRRTVPVNVVQTYVGIEPTTTLTMSEWAVWQLRERLADVLATPQSQS